MNKKRGALYIRNGSIAPLVGQLGILFAYLSRKMGGCRLPMNIRPAVASRLFSCWNAITELRIAKNGWALASDEPALKEFFEIVSRNVDH